MQRKTYDAVDLMKWICSILVVYIHMSPVLTGAPFVDSLIADGVCRIAVPFFFATSAFFLFRKMDRTTPEKGKNRKALWRFCGRMLLLYTVWIVIYIGYDMFHRYYNHNPQMPWYSYVKGFWLSGIQYHLWYLMSTVYAAPLVYLLWRAGKKALIGACLGLHILQCLERPYRISWIFDSVLMQTLRVDFALPYDGLLLGVSLMCLGCICLENHTQKTSRQWLRRLLIATPVFLAECSVLIYMQGDRLDMDKPLSAVVVVYYLVNWLFSADFRFSKPWMGKLLRTGSLWIYCVHPLVKRLYVWWFAHEGLFQFAVVCVCSVASGLVYALIKVIASEKWSLKRLRKHSEG